MQCNAMYNVVLVQTVPRPGGPESFSEVINLQPLELSDAERQRDRLLQLMGSGVSGFRTVSGCHIEPAEAFASEEARLDWLLKMAETGVSTLLLLNGEKRKRIEHQSEVERFEAWLAEVPDLTAVRGVSFFASALVGMPLLETR